MIAEIFKMFCSTDTALLPVLRESTLKIDFFILVVYIEVTSGYFIHINYYMNFLYHFVLIFVVTVLLCKRIRLMM